jgi:hypothetical protein
MVNSQIAGQELMTEEEREERKSEAEKVKKTSGKSNAYWIDVPQLNTVGYLTTLAGSMVTAHVIGYLTGRYTMPKNRIEINLGTRGTQIVEKDEKADLNCLCQSFIGAADQHPDAVISSAPGHWDSPIIHLI